MMEKRMLIASWLFLIGSVLFTIDAVSEIVSSFSISAVIHVSESVLFLVGSWFFMPENDSTPKTDP